MSQLIKSKTHDFSDVLVPFLFATVLGVQVAELATYLALLADWNTLLEGPQAWGPWLLLVITVAMPVVYSRRIVDFGSVEC
jgi:hypothetical protein